ncbi:MAG: hypothetical protein LBH20_00605 [Treponema sp.]|jgi:hypothetical protein|nr:hypothetical protein [Treponema sp.]
MKRIAAVFAVFAALAATGGLFAQEITLSGELKTGFYMEQETIGSADPVAKGGMTNNDGDSGSGEGRLRMDFSSVYGNVGLRVRFQIEPDGLGPFLPTWSFAYGYGNLFDEQLTISAGLLGESPWGTGGPRLRSDPESREYIAYNKLSEEPYIASEGLIGIRFEYKPAFVPGLNIGFVLNQPDQVAVAFQEQTFGDVLGESVIGAAYTHDYFAVRVGYRFDSKADAYRNKTNEGGRLTYRLEERILGTLVDGMQVWLNGSYYGIGCEQQEIQKMINGQPEMVKLGSGEYFVNWLYWLWDSDDFIAKLDIGLGIYKSYNNEIFRPIERQEYQSLEFLPSFNYKFFNNLLQAGLALGVGMEFGPGKTYKDSPYQYISIEPQLRLNIGVNAFITTVYTFTDKYAWFNENEMDRRGEKSVKHAINIRTVFTF